MIEASVDRKMTESGQATVDTADLNWQLPSPETIASGALDAGLSHTAEKMGLDQQQVLECLRRGDRAACRRYRYALAKRVAEAMGVLDESIKAVYVMDYDATPEDVCFCDTGADPRIHLIVWTQRRTHALSALAAAIDRALVRKYCDVVCSPDLQNLLDVQIVDETDVEQRSGYGAMLSSIHRPPLPLWERDEGL